VEVMTTKAKRSTVYNRLLLGMSIADVMTSIGYMFSTFPMPTSVEELPWTFGTATTCTVQGFFVQLGIVPPVYHTCLSVYYVLIVKFGVTQDKIKKYTELIFHMTAIFFGFGTAFASIALDLLSNATLWCWIAPQGDNALNYRYIFFYIPLWLSMVIVLGLNIWIYETVRRREQKAEKLHAIHHERHGQPYSKMKTSVVLTKSKSNVSFLFGHHPSNVFTTLKNDTSENKINDVKNKREGSSALCIYPIEEHTDVSSSVQLQDRDENQDEAKSLREPEGSSSIEFRVSRVKNIFNSLQESISSFFFIGDDDKKDLSDDEDNLFQQSLDSMKTMVLPEKIAMRLSRNIQKRQQQSSREFKSSQSMRSADAKFVLATVEDYPSAARQYAATYRIGARVIFYQSIAYVLGFWIIWLFPTIYQIVQNHTSQPSYALIFFRALFEPLQGLFNFVVYRFAHYLRLKELHPRWTTGRLLRRTLQFTFTLNRSDFDERYIVKNSGIKSIDEEVELQVSDDDSNSDESDYSIVLKSSNDASVSVEESRVLRRMSSLMGDLMTEFTDDPAVLNQNFVEIIGDELFSFPQSLPTASAFPTIYARQSFSQPPSSFPDVAPMTDFPVAQSSTECINSLSNEHNDNKTLIESTEDDNKTTKKENHPSKENHDNMATVQSTKDDSQTSKNKNDDLDASLGSEDIILHPESEKTIDSEEEKQLKD